MRMREYRMLRKACLTFSVVILYLSCNAIDISYLGVKLAEVMLLLYVVYWIRRNNESKSRGRVIFLGVAIAGMGLGSLSSSVVLRAIASLGELLSAMIYLYTLRCCDKFNFAFLVQFFHDALYLPFSYIYDFFERENYTQEERIKNQKIANGIILTIVLSVFILIPLYMSGDYVFRSWMIILWGWLLDNVFAITISIVFCWIPAMFIFSYVKGINEDVEPAVELQQEMFDTLDKNKFFFNGLNIKMIFIGGTIINVVYAIAQAAYVLQKEGAEGGVLRKDNSIVPIFTAVVINLFILMILSLIIIARKINNDSIDIFSYNIYYAISLVLVWVSVGWRYVNIVFKYGLKGIWPIAGLLLLLILAGVACNIMSVINDYEDFVKCTFYGIMIAVLGFCICIPEFWIGKINVAIFNYKYEHQLLVNAVGGDSSVALITQQDLDMEYLQTLGIWAIPSLASLKDIANSYQENQKMVKDIAEKEIIDILKEDLSVKEREELENLQTGQIFYILDALEQNKEYKLPGYKKVILDIVQQAYLE